ncbi:Carboxylesterase family protein [Trichomonas vaginalis G3]|uniref:Carboxylic ester hydrolase n=1 Tax=Trichomonas vaginalis (strain ATCC PRA-98 / G3) TaxID=412133 RepID=A2FUX4_TRIV3|nr:carboxylic ester hydrolase protein [Trichomonas vaginalis G3]EAX91290.1 Carboxylesterase family protein [Trichomonas vaginalis G3]KAI5534750.1 carboxylic ester hydrolase protein [Trichomonas vaginalis G3]|eukprot:XP_001304220.1 Carboxylesterase family protein [Trichomonas vaginalis G3]
MSIVKTKYGDLQGVDLESGNRVYRGIPFAKPPIGPLRFKRPVPPDNWEGVRDATQFAKIPSQKDFKGFYEKEFFPNGKPENSEDCLYLNVWAPPVNPEKKYPVMFWIHGGSYEAGFSHGIEFDGDNIAKKECILVTTEYRLNVFGFLAHPILEADGQKSGNQALYDLILSLQWVQDNIEAFGGDKSNVTVFGQSAGAMLTQILLVSPMAANLFHKAILQSGGGYMVAPFLRNTYKDIVKTSEKFFKLMNIKTYDDLMSKTKEEIRKVYQDFPSLRLTPYIDGEIFPAKLEDCYQSKNYKNCPVIAGSNESEFDYLSYKYFYHCNLNMVKKQSENGFTPVYLYYMTFHPPGDDNPGCFHSAELWYVFSTFDRCWRPFGEKDKNLSEMIVTYWTNFSKTGNPNSEGLPQWTPYTLQNKKHLKIDFEGTQMEDAKWF